MVSIAVAAGKQKPTRLGRFLDRNRWLRWAMLIGSIAAAVVLSIVADANGAEDHLLGIDTDVYLAVAGLFVAALALERVTELVIAPWVGNGDRAVDRAVLIASLSFVVAVALAAMIGLSAVPLLGVDGGGGADSTLAGLRWLDLLAVGFALSGGAKPLHDLVSRLEKNVQERKRGARDESDDLSETERLAFAGGAAHALSVLVDRDEQPIGRFGAVKRLFKRNGPTAPIAPDEAVAAELAELTHLVGRILPGWRTKPSGRSVVATAHVAAEPGTDEYRRELYSAAHRVEATVGLRATPLGPKLAKDDNPRAAPANRRWALEALGLDAATMAPEGTRDRRVRVAVLDTGYAEHPHSVPASRRAAGYDALDDDGDPRDPSIAPGGGVPIPKISGAGRLFNWLADGADFDLMTANGHGTGVASVIAAGGDASRSISPSEWWEASEMIGVAPDAEVMPIRVMGGPVHVRDDDVARGVRKAFELNADVISMSLGGFGFQDLKQAVKDATERGVIVVAAAGNGFGVVVDPAAYGETIGVSAVTPDLVPFAAESSRGPEVDVVAPGHLVWRAAFDEADLDRPNVSPSSGTTYATAHVAGVAARWLDHHGVDKLRERYPADRLPKLFKQLLIDTCTPWTGSAGGASPDEWGAGIVNVPALLARPVLGPNGEAVVEESAYIHAFIPRDELTQLDRIAGGVASVFIGRGTYDTRAKTVEALAKVPSLLAAEIVDNRANNTVLWSALQGRASGIAVGTGHVASDELKAVLDATDANAERAYRTRGRELAPLDPEWGVGFSKPLKNALEGKARTATNYGFLGLLALAAAVVVAVVFSEAATSGSVHLSGIAGAFGVLMVGVYGMAQGIERLLELTVARRVFRDVPGREVDRALILLGAGVFVGVVGSILFDIGFMALISNPDTTTASGPWYGTGDALVTGLATGGGAKPVHDLLSRIRLSVPVRAS
ncbi:MAG: S8 family peptidase [Acidimicrobiales bacterium]